MDATPLKDELVRNLGHGVTSCVLQYAKLPWLQYDKGHKGGGWVRQSATNPPSVESTALVVNGDHTGTVQTIIATVNSYSNCVS